MDTCLICKKISVVTQIDKYATVKHCSQCGNFRVKYFECCNNQIIRNVIYYQKDDRRTVREQCKSCGKRLNKPAMSFSKFKEFELGIFNEDLSEQRVTEMIEIKSYYDELIKGNRSRIRYNLYEAYYYTIEWKELRQKVFQRDNYKCFNCGNNAEQVHHMTYERFKNESMDDLSSVCTPCHSLIHNKPMS